MKATNEQVRAYMTRLLDAVMEVMPTEVNGHNVRYWVGDQTSKPSDANVVEARMSTTKDIQGTWIPPLTPDPSVTFRDDENNIGVLWVDECDTDDAANGLMLTQPDVMIVEEVAASTSESDVAKHAWVKLLENKHWKCRPEAENLTRLIFLPNAQRLLHAHEKLHVYYYHRVGVMERSLPAMTSIQIVVAAGGVDFESASESESLVTGGLRDWLDSYNGEMLDEHLRIGHVNINTTGNESLGGDFCWGVVRFTVWDSSPECQEVSYKTDIFQEIGGDE